eukprot:TRINITY_DN4726_c0_g1_i1.p1 TRINITY_DN4726_c0_g1~~TRINITY_DN4726_c0_g1_i1.p1  ORF type:complete len:129 (-),score=27.83 TRINITY_DN4726_c0_g1_i1:24-410(-)
MLRKVLARRSSFFGWKTKKRGGNLVQRISQYSSDFDGQEFEKWLKNDPDLYKAYLNVQKEAEQDSEKLQSSIDIDSLWQELQSYTPEQLEKEIEKITSDPANEAMLEELFSDLGEDEEPLLNLSLIHI